jgi:hypothetical protein
MRIQFIKDHGIYRAGAVVDYPHDGAADVLVRRGLAATVSEPRSVAPKPSTVAIQPKTQPKPKPKPKPKAKRR